MKVVYIVGQDSFKMLLDTVPAQKEEALIYLLSLSGCKMMVVEPVLTMITLNHELIHILRGMGLLTGTVAVEKISVVKVLLILIVKFIIEEFASLRHSAVSTVTSEM
jgi:hypothetical protein